MTTSVVPGHWRARAWRLVADSGARGITRTPPQLRRLAMRGPQRPLILSQIFRGMERQLDRRRAKGAATVVHWEIAREGGGADRWQVVIEDGRCRASRKLDRAPAATLTLDALTFLDLVTGVASGPQLYMSGKLKLTGNLMVAAQMQSYFRMPGR